MFKQGRNELCQCGSGKKHKRCCGKNNNLIVMNPNVIMKTDADEIRSDFYQFVMANKLLVDKALGELASKTDIDKKTIVDKLYDFTLDLIVFDYPIKDEMTLFDLYLNAKNKAIKDRVLRNIHSWRERYISVYEVKDFYGDDGLILIDLLAQEEKIVRIYTTLEDINIKDIHLGRLLPIESWYEYLNGCLIFDEHDMTGFIDEIKGKRNLLEALGGEYKDWGDFLKSEGHVFIETLLEGLADENDNYLDEDSLDNDYFDEDSFYAELLVKKFLSKPHRLLDRKSPLQASYDSKMEKKLKKFIDKLCKGQLDKEFSDVKLSQEIELVKELIYGEGYLSSGGLDVIPFENETYSKEALLFVEGTKGKLFIYDIEKALSLWYLYTCEMNPVIKKSGSWASVLEHITLDDFWGEYQPTQKDIAKKYGVSYSTLSNNSRKIMDFIYNTIDSYEKQLTPQEMLKTSPNSINKPMTEKNMLAISEILQKQDFKSIEEANDFLTDLLQNGMLEENKDKLSNEEEAQELIYSAWESNSKSEIIKLANRALKLDNNCVDAYNLLAEYDANNIDHKIALYVKALDVFVKSKGTAYFEENMGHFWGLLETRPFMRANMGFVQCFIEKGSTTEAIDNMYTMLDLNPNDNQGVRYLLVPSLIENGRYKEAHKLIGKYYEESCDWLFNRALLSLATKGANAKSEQLLEKAIDSNKYVVDYLLGIKSIPKTLPQYVSSGSKEEAITYAAYGKKAWEKTWGAISWLKLVYNK
ncbi:hypothetical protein F8154_08340 [Alkaliphilus pronyensis]|uniref:SEC-C domain-containing protein n=1 Tax=Alkaliphilus pronyensis TaxID=1482732 RepID=A0A6I0F889_9FIRM|nr:SEC-C metal-binding domain-containing protein [Alkaliphilus pronyensis]KAB3534724.1 hypothetical protein F8154_08340 [Alkaliphilus pronyensis]